MKRSIQGLLAVAVVGIIAATVAVIAMWASDDEIDATRPVVRSVTVDYESRLLLVEGERLFRSPVTPKLLLDNQSLFVCPVCFNEKHIFAELPRELEPGEYRLDLYVSRRSINLRQEEIRYPLTISEQGSRLRQPLAGSMPGDAGSAP